MMVVVDAWDAWDAFPWKKEADDAELWSNSLEWMLSFHELHQIFCKVKYFILFEFALGIFIYIYIYTHNC